MLKRSALKVNLVLVSNFINRQNLEIDQKTFATKNEVISVATNLKEWYLDNVINKLQTKLEGFEEEGSGWALHEISHLKVNINKYEPIRGSTYINLPRFIALKKAVVNVKNNDEFCFLWAIVSALYPAQNHVERVSSYPHFEDVLNHGSIKFPIKLHDIKKFEQLNNLAINVYCIEKKRVMLLMPSSNTDRENVPTINLLLLQSNEGGGIAKSGGGGGGGGNTRYHFAWIKNISRLFSSQVSNKKCAKFFCNICLNHFSSNNFLERHIIACHQLNSCSVRLPKESEKYLEFTHFSNKEKFPCYLC
ncbi:hypothetical protein RI129_000194 [Pyrocoelia pectoralis]|uniref:C2H2-type domain-containing protein n=1 Tax=Pyrocoelia pectoralis TaxID=417401 RepID=A0AAN7Z5G0_9COLE